MWPWNRKKLPPQQQRRDDDGFDRLAEMMRGLEGEKSFDWNHYQAVVQGQGNPLFQSEFNATPSKRIAKASFVQEPILNLCTEAISKQFQGPRFALKKTMVDGNRAEKLIYKHKFLEYLRDAGSKVESSAVFTANGITDLILTGDAYWWNDPTNKDKKRLPSQLVEPIIVNNKIQKYRVSPSGDGSDHGNFIELDPMEVTHIKLPNPFSPHVGLGFYIALALPTLIDKYGREYIVGFFLRGGNTTGILQTKTSNMDQLIRLIKTIMQAVGGRRNMHSDKILPEGVEWKGQGSSFKDIQITSLFKENWALFRARTGATNTVLGLAENLNRATAFAEMEFFWRATILPMQKLWCDGIMSSEIWKRFGLEGYELVFDNSDVPYLDNIDRDLDQDQKFKAVLTINERRKRLGYESLGADYDKLETEISGGNPGMLAFSIPQPPAIQAQPDDVLMLNAGSGETAMGKWKAEEERIQEPGRAVVALFGKEFGAWEQIVLDNLLNRNAALQKVHARTDEFSEQLKSKLIDPAMVAYQNQINQVRMSFAGRVTKDEADDRQAVLDALKLRARDVIAGRILTHGRTSFMGYSETAMNNIYSFINDELEKGSSLTDVAAAVRQRFNETYSLSEAYAGQAETIVRTEFGSAVSFGQAQFGEDLATVTRRMTKSWVTLGDNHVRESHDEAESHPIEGESADVIDAEWSNGLRYPRDPRGKPEEVINCRCTIRWQALEWD